MNRVLVTGAAGFIGMHVARQLLDTGYIVHGLDNLNEYYDVALKHDRLSRLVDDANFHLHKVDLSSASEVSRIVRENHLDYVVHLAAQAGVRYSLDRPDLYCESNLVGFLNILEACRRATIRHLVFASSSSVYGANSTVPFRESHPVNHPVSFYAATKKANELMAHAYSHLYSLPVTGLRFFTVYGPWGRPDMAYFSFTKAILEGRPINLYNFGRMRRDFTYIDDIVEGIIRVMRTPATADPGWSSASPDPATSSAPYRIYNIGNNRPVELLHFVRVLEENLGVRAVKNLLPMQAGDVTCTFAGVDALRNAVGFEPSTPIEVGIPRFIEWYKTYYSHHLAPEEETSEEAQYACTKENIVCR
jgi:UDP-glucuronate 4-epimerase